jgi:hypothetical protein
MGQFHTTHTSTPFFPKNRICSPLIIFLKCVFKYYRRFPFSVISSCFFYTFYFPLFYYPKNIYRNVCNINHEISQSILGHCPSAVDYWCSVTRWRVTISRKNGNLDYTPVRDWNFHEIFNYVISLTSIPNNVQVQIFGCTRNFHARVIYVFRPI